MKTYLLERTGKRHRIAFAGMILFLLFLSIQVDSVRAQAIPVLEADSLALVALYNATDGPNWSYSYNWLTGPVATWYGVTVSDLRVRELNLLGNNLAGPLPPEIGALTALKYLILQDNEIPGPLPPELGQLVALVDLDLEGNILTGPIPPELGQLTNLEYLNFQTVDAWTQESWNELSGSIPPELGSLTNLKELLLDSNPLTGPIPLSFTNLKNLDYFSTVLVPVCNPEDPDFQNWVNSVRGSSRSNCPVADQAIIVSGNSWRVDTLIDGAWTHPRANFGLFADAPYPGLVPEDRLEEIFTYPKALPIWYNPLAIYNGYNGPVEVFFKRVFVVENPPGGYVRATASIYADDDFAFYVNGTFVQEDTNSIRGPLIEVDVSPFLVEGLNVFSIRVTDSYLFGPKDSGYEVLLFSAEFDLVDDTTAPECELVEAVKNSHIKVRVEDPGSGLKEVKILKKTNSTVVTETFNTGSTAPVFVTATKIKPTKTSVLELEVTDMAGNVTRCDPVLTTLAAEVPSTFALEGNYPNPFNPSTTIRFHIAEPSHVTLTVFDVMGRTVARLVDQEMPAGSYAAEWDGKSDAGLIVAGGIYFYRLEAGSYVETRAMSLVK